ncbi:MAG: phosphoethanolamine--lipid A transferase [Burkholderiales bacterium]|nr:phosphoethanolamine--lipid A transferase [Burkholderiales bacterium]
MRIPRPALHTETLVLACAAFLMLAGNQPFWRAALAGRPWGEIGTWGFAAAVYVALTAFYLAFAALFSTRHTVRPLLAVLLLVTASAAYYMERYAIYLDRAMLRNVLATDVREARDLLGWGLAAHLLLWGVAPAALLWWPHLKRRPLGRALAVRAGWVLGSVAVGVGSLLLVFADFASMMRNQPDMRYLVTPGNIVAGLAANTWGRAKRPNQPRTVVGADAKQDTAAAARSRPSLFVLVVGETARAQNFALNGYARPTNPELAARNVIYFPNAKACGTSTEVSLPCMFSPYGRANYNEEKILTSESVLHVLARAGVKVLWRDNQSGCKGVCEGLPAEQVDHKPVPALCAGGECLDEMLLQGMDGVLADGKGNLLVVMHQMGSHGPAYFKRYPPAQKKFTPACETEDLRKCAPAEIVNAYDNSLLYTDYFLGRVIDFLNQAQKTHDTALLYMSDHGESLGEGGLYLHGMPYAIAPDVQTQVPFLMWLSPAFRTAFGVDEACLRGEAKNRQASHDNLFHSLLGIFGVRASVYDRALDLFAPCRAASAK